MKLPGENTFGPRPTGAALQPIADPGGSGLGRALQEVGGTVQDIGVAREQEADRLSLAKAKAHWIKAQAGSLHQLENDDDYASFGERHEQALSEARSEALEMVQDPATRALFEAETDVDHQRSLIAADKLSRQRGRDVELAGLNQSIADLKDISVASGVATRQAAAGALADHIDALEERGFITAQEAQQYREGVALDMGVALLKTKPPEEQIRLLKEDPLLAEQLGEAKRLELLQGASDALTLENSQGHADRILSGTSDRAEAMAAVAKIDDPDERKLARSEVVYRLNQAKLAEGERETAGVDAALGFVAEGRGSIRDYAQANSAQWSELSGSTRQQLLAADGKRTTKTDPLHYQEVLELMAEGNVLAARQHLQDNQLAFSQGDMTKLLDRTFKESKGLESFRNINQRVSDYMTANRIGKVRAGQFRMAIDREVEGFIEANGREPTREELTGLMDAFARKEGWFDSVAYQGETLEEQQDILLDQTRKADRASVDRATQSLTSRLGREPTDRELAEFVYRVMQASGGVIPQ